MSDTPLTSPVEKAARPYDLILWGATSFVGQITARYLFERHGVGGGPDGVTWAIGARSADKLEALKKELGPGAADLPMVTGDSRSVDDMERLAGSARVVCTTVGPYALYGNELIAACAKLGTDYCDLTGEVQWMARTVAEHQAAAEASGARLVHTCGFDSIPSDLGVFFANKEAQARFGKPIVAARTRVRSMKGGFSGGTLASLTNALLESQKDKASAKAMRDPYCLRPPTITGGPRQPSPVSVVEDEALKTWVGPFVMAAVNAPVVHRSNALMGQPYGADFTYHEGTSTGPGLSGKLKAQAILAGLGGFTAGLSFGPTRALMTKFLLPKPGEGPSPEEQRNGFFKFIIAGETAEGELVKVQVAGDRDPGYGSTAKMLGEAAVCLAKDMQPQEGGHAVPGGGLWTPASAMGEALLTRLQAHAGLTFKALN